MQPRTQTLRDAPDAGREGSSPAACVCMHVLSTARTDERVMREATALADAHFDVTVVDVEHDATRPRVEMLRGVRLKHIMLPAGLRKHYSPTHPAAWLAFKALRVWRALYAVTTTAADAYHAHDITALPACLLAATLRRKPLVFDAHELPLVQPHIARRRALTAVGARFLRLALARCTAAITVSPPLVAELRRLYGGPRAEVVRNVPTYQPPIQSDLLRQRLGLDARTRIALYQGGIQDNRALDVLARAGRYLDPDIVIVLLGDGPLSGTIERLIVAEGVSERVKLLPAVPYSELLRWTASADLGLCLFDPNYSLSIRLCLPNKLFEYLMAGLPVLTTPLDAVAELLECYDAGAIAPPPEPKAVAVAISALLRDEERRARMRRNALAAAASDLRWDVERHRLTDLYARLIADRAVAQPRRVRRRARTHAPVDVQPRSG